MKNRIHLPTLSCAFLLGLAANALQAQSVPMLCGASGTAPNSKLTVANATTYSLASGYAQPLVYTLVSNLVQFRGNVSRIRGFYNTTNFAFHALPGSNAAAAMPGSFIACEVTSVSGPPGGTFSFWEQGAKEPTYSYPVGAPPVAARFDVTDISRGGGLPYGDPAGAIPGRRFTVDLPGEYVVGFKLSDLSKNSLEMGALHEPSDPVLVKFTTTVQPSLPRIAVTNEVVTLTLNQGGLTNIVVEYSPSFTPPTWTPVAGPFANAPIGGNTRTLLITNQVSQLTRFYRLRGTSP